MVWGIRKALAERAKPETMFQCFRHGEDNMKIFMGTEDETVKIGGCVYHCTRGGYLPKERRA